MYLNNTFSDEKMCFAYTFSETTLIFDKKNIKFIRFQNCGLKSGGNAHAEAFDRKIG